MIRLTAALLIHQVLQHIGSGEVPLGVDFSSHRDMPFLQSEIERSLRLSSQECPSILKARP